MVACAASEEKTIAAEKLLLLCLNPFPKLCPQVDKERTVYSYCDLDADGYRGAGAGRDIR